MTDVKRLLEQATSLPWTAQWDGTIVGPATGVEGEFSKNADAELAVYAVNHLPDYLAAVEALERALEQDWAHDINCGIDALRPGSNPCNCGVERDKDEARAVLARLRDEVPA